MAEKKRLKIAKTVLFALLIVCVALELFKVKIIPDSEVKNAIVTVLITRTLAAAFFAVLIRESGVNVFHRKTAREYALSLLFVIPALLISINNLPALSLITGNCRVDESFVWVLVFALQCCAVGAFEELAFRGLLFPYFLKKCSTKAHIFLCIAATSCVFGLYHLFNLFEGAAIGDTLLQVGYSALIGAMCALCMLITGDVAVPIALHSIYNFCGLVVPTLGSGTWWDTPTVIFTAVLGTATFIFYLIVFLKKKSFRLLDANMLKGDEPQ